MITVYVSIGNSDDKLTQAEWAAFYREVNLTVRAAHVHGQWVSEPASSWQNACWCIEFNPDGEVITRDGQRMTRREHLRRRLADIAVSYRQDSIAWAEATTEFLGTAPETTASLPVPAQDAAPAPRDTLNPSGGFQADGR